MDTLCILIYAWFVSFALVLFSNILCLIWQIFLSSIILLVCRYALGVKLVILYIYNMVAQSRIIAYSRIILEQ